MEKSTKSKLRAELLNTRLLVSEEEATERHSSIVGRVIELIDWQAVKSVHCYAASSVRNEPATGPILEYIWQNHPDIVVAAPIVQQGQMVSAAVNAQTVWRQGSFSVPEPISKNILPKDTQFDVIIVPLLGFNEQGFRIGYGGGYYDRFLATQPRALTIGLCYEAGLIDFEPEPHDIPLQMVVTEQSTRNFVQTKRPNSR